MLPRTPRQARQSGVTTSISKSMELLRAIRAGRHAHLYLRLPTQERWIGLCPSSWYPEACESVFREAFLQREWGKSSFSANATDACALRYAF